MRYFSNLFR